MITEVYDEGPEGWQVVTVTLPDGSKVDSSPIDKTAEEGAARQEYAKSLGFTDLWEMVLWHDPAHLRLCLALDLTTSPALMRKAHGDPTHADDDLVAYEEAMVEAAAKFYNEWRKRNA